MYDVVIIGSGICGCSTAYMLGKYRLKVLVLEKGADLCAGATRGNSGMLHAGYDPRPGSNMAYFNVRGNRMMDSLCEELDVPINRCGTLVFASNEAEERVVEQLKENGDANGVAVRIVRPPELFEMQPKLGRSVTAALWAPLSGMVSPYSLVYGLAENACVNGVEFRLQTEAEGFERARDGWTIRTGRGSLEARCVVNCAGTHAARLNNLVSPRKLTILPRHGMNLLLDRSVNRDVTAIINEVPHDLPGGGHTKGLAVMPSVDGTLVLGCSTEQLGDLDAVPATRRGIDGIIAYFQEMWNLFPIGSDGAPFPKDKVIAYYAGIRAHCTEDDFIVGEADGAPGFLNAVGIESPGLTSGPAIGEYLGRLCVERLRAEKKGPGEYRFGRVAKKKFRCMTREERETAIRLDPDYARIVCRCEQVTEAEIRDAIRRPLGARSIDGVKMRTRAGMGRCQGGFCSPRVLEILCEELQCDPLEITQRGGGSYVLASKACGAACGEGQK